MPRSRVVHVSHGAATGASRRLGVWLGVLALLLQVLVPLARPQAAWAEQGLFPPTCSIHRDQGAAAPSDIPDCGACALCHAQPGDRMGALPERVVSLAFDRVAVTMVLPPAPAALPDGAQARPPLPSRGPPAA
ncbi:MAG: hypothetical protein ACM31D_19660 [Bacteroidota bacterium]